MLFSSVYLVGDETYPVADRERLNWLVLFKIAMPSKKYPNYCRLTRFDTETKESTEICRSDDG